MALFPMRHRSLQYRTDSQSRAHLRRQLKGRPHRAHSLSGGASEDFEDVSPPPLA